MQFNSIIQFCILPSEFFNRSVYFISFVCIVTFVHNHKPILFLKHLILFSHLSLLKKNLIFFFTTIDKLVQGKTILFVIFSFNCINSGVIIVNIKNCNFIIVIRTVSKMPLVRLVKESKAKPASTSRGASRISRKVNVSKGTMELARKCKKTKNEKKDAINKKDRNLQYNEIEGSGNCFIWEDPNVALHNDTIFGAEVSIFFALRYRLLGIKNEK